MENCECCQLKKCECFGVSKNKSKQKHTQTPFQFIKTKYKDGPVYWIKSGDIFIGKLYGHEGQPIEENKKLIETAINSLPILLQAAKAYLESVENDLGVVDIDEEEIEELRQAINQVEGK